MSEQQELPQQGLYVNINIIKGSIIMKTIDSDVLAGYNSGIEKGRLHRSLGLFEYFS